MPKRGCGDSRVEGGIYMECELSEFGSPLEAFFVDSPISGVSMPNERKPVPVMKAFNLTARGVQVHEHQGVFHVFDVVGAQHYPDVVDFIEETKRLGASRRCELPASEYAKLTSRSRMILVHPRASALNHQEYYKLMPPDQLNVFACPRRLTEHCLKSALAESTNGNRGQVDLITPDTMCAGLWAFDLSPQAERDTVVKEDHGVIAIRRTIPCGADFLGFYSNLQAEDQHTPAIFLSLPISKLVCVDPRGEHESKRRKLEQAQIQHEVVSE